MESGNDTHLYGNLVNNVHDMSGCDDWASVIACIVHVGIYKCFLYLADFQDNHNYFKIYIIFRDHFFFCAEAF
jgi:hypothetical protein